MRILIIDDHFMIRAGLMSCLREILSDLELEFAEARDCNSAIDQREPAPDMVLVDLHMPGNAPVDVLERVKKAFGQSKIVAISADPAPGLVRAAYAAGLDGYILKSNDRQVLLHGIGIVRQGLKHFPVEALLQDEAARVVPPVLPPEWDKLSRQQKVVLYKVSEGKSNKLIAREMELALGTVKAHLSAVFRTLGVETRSQVLSLLASTGADMRALAPPPRAPGQM